MSSERAIVRQLVTFGRCLREAGLEVGPGRLADALTGITHVDVTRPDVLGSRLPRSDGKD